MLTTREDLLNELRKLNAENKVLLFVAGIKPALTSTRWSSVRELLEANFPFIPLKQKRTGKINMNLYFQTEEQKERFVRECTDDGRFTCHIKLGLELGFPPFACEVVGKNINLKDDVHEKYKDYGEHWLAHNDSVLNQELEERGYIKDTIGINYHGVQFGMERGTAKETYEWLLENMPVPSNLQTVVIVKDNFTFKKIEQYIQENEV